MLEKKISLIMEGPDENSGDVDLDNFLKEIEQLKKVISNIDEEINGGKKTSRLAVVGLSHNSPATIALEIRTRLPFEDLSNTIFQRFHDLIKKVQSHNKAEDENFTILGELYKLFSPIGKSMKSIVIGFNEERVLLSQDMENYIEEILTKNEKKYSTSVEGMLEEINVHNNKNLFKIFLDRAYSGYIRCQFPDDKLPQASNALKKRVLVKGTGKFRKGDIFPHQMEVLEIKVLPSANDLIPLISIMGVAPEATADLSSEDFVKTSRIESERDHEHE